MVTIPARPRRARTRSRSCTQDASAATGVSGAGASRSTAVEVAVSPVLSATSATPPPLRPPLLSLQKEAAADTAARPAADTTARRHPCVLVMGGRAGTEHNQTHLSPRRRALVCRRQDGLYILELVLPPKSTVTPRKNTAANVS